MKALLILLLMTLAVGVAKGQPITKSPGPIGDYKFQDIIYNYKDMGSVFVNNKKAYKKYNRSIRNRKAAIALGYVSAGVVSIGLTTAVILDSRQMYCDTFCDSFGAIVLSALVAAFTGTVATTLMFIETGQRRGAIKLINGQTKDLGYSTPNLELKATMGANGIGLTLNF